MESKINIHIITTNQLDSTLSLENHVNLLKIARYIKMLQQSSMQTILLDLGNHFLKVQPKATHFHRNALVTALNILNFDASCIGLNDLIDPSRKFNQIQSLSQFRHLSANVIHTVTKEPYYGTPYIIKQIGQLKIGIIGISANGKIDDDMTSEECLEVEDTISACKRWIRYMHDHESLDFVIALHQPQFEFEQIEASDIVKAIEGIDLLITTEAIASTNIEDTKIISIQSDEKFGHIQLVFKERTNSFELKQITSKAIDVSMYQEDIQMYDTLYYDLKV